MHLLCIKEHASKHDEERAQSIFIGTSFAENGEWYRVVSASRDRAHRLLLASVKEGASMTENTLNGTRPEQEAELLTVGEVAKQLRVDDTTVRRWIAQGTLAAVTLPTRGARHVYRVRKSTLAAILQGGGA